MAALGIVFKDELPSRQTASETGKSHAIIVEALRGGRERGGSSRKSRRRRHATGKRVCPKESPADHVVHRTGSKLGRKDVGRVFGWGRSKRREINREGSTRRRRTASGLVWKRGGTTEGPGPKAKQQRSEGLAARGSLGRRV